MKAPLEFTPSFAMHPPNLEIVYRARIGTAHKHARTNALSSLPRTPALLDFRYRGVIPASCTTLNNRAARSDYTVATRLTLAEARARERARGKKKKAAATAAPICRGASGK